MTEMTEEKNALFAALENTAHETPHGTIETPTLEPTIEIPTCPLSEPTEPTEPTEPDETKASEVTDGIDAETLENAKRELGIGGAAFCDELMTDCPEALARLREAGKTLHGLFNWAYSYALAEYVKKNGRKTGGGFWRVQDLLEKYLDPSVKEGDRVEEPKVTTRPKDVSSETTAATVARVASAAATAAKRTRRPRKTKAAATQENVIVPQGTEAPKPADGSVLTGTPAVMMPKRYVFKGVDWSKVFGR